MRYAINVETLRLEKQGIDPTPFFTSDFIKLLPRFENSVFHPDHKKDLPAIASASIPQEDYELMRALAIRGHEAVMVATGSSRSINLGNGSWLRGLSEHTQDCGTPRIFGANTKGFLSEEQFLHFYVPFRRNQQVMIELVGFPESLTQTLALAEVAFSTTWKAMIETSAEPSEQTAVNNDIQPPQSLPEGVLTLSLQQMQPNGTWKELEKKSSSLQYGALGFWKVQAKVHSAMHVRMLLQMDVSNLGELRKKNYVLFLRLNSGALNVGKCFPNKDQSESSCL
jgi:hypothetical protein